MLQIIPDAKIAQKKLATAKTWAFPTISTQIYITKSKACMYLLVRQQKDSDKDIYSHDQ